MVKRNRLYTLKMLIYGFFSVVVFLSGCEQLLEEALTQNVLIEENLYESNAYTAEGQIIPITSEAQLAKGSFFKTMCHMVEPVDIPDSDLFLTVVSKGGGKITGNVKNNNNSPVVFGLYFSNTGGLENPSEQATFIGSVNIDALETVTIQGLDDFNQSSEDVIENMVSFFVMNPGIRMIYVYLTGEPDPVDLTIQHLQFVLNPSFHITQIIDVNEQYTQYVDQIEDVSDVVITGSVKNNGSSTVTIILTVKNGGGVWEGESIIESGETLQLADQFNQLTEEGLEILESVLRYYVNPGQAIQVDLYIIGEEDINITLHSIVFSGTITVLL
ncbi:hypothetical protein JW824_15215 [bacterium]|nr:hypothetical protein [bacterium]